MPHNLLGDIRAEEDHLMLDKAFYETSEYRTLIETEKRFVVIGRRGTGKSALYYKLLQHYRKNQRASILEIILNEAHIIGLRSLERVFDSNPSYLRAACALAWEYAILNELLLVLLKNYKVKSDPEIGGAVGICRKWTKLGDDICSRLFSFLDEVIDLKNPIEKRVALFAQNPEFKTLRSAIVRAKEISGHSIRIVADKLDEGYQPDTIGIAIINGLINSMGKISSLIPETTSIAFLRDNIARAIQSNDPDYSRNIEGDVLRLHWDEYHLFNMLCNRIRSAFNILHEKNLKVWEQVTARNLKSMDGFRQCLRLTLYRPRDLLVLLNTAFNNAISQTRNEIIEDDIAISAKRISCSRLDDLNKEYKGILPGLSLWTEVFVGGGAKMPLAAAEEKLLPLFSRESSLPEEKQMLAILKSPQEIIRCLYSIGFLGILKPSISSFVFCHDGRQPDLSLENSHLLIHPCYWIALNLKEESFSANDADEIHDEYDIEISSETPEIRKQRLGQVIAELTKISEGEEDASAFEEWCLNAIKILFPKGLVNIELHPNKGKTQRRDIVARNNEGTDTWKRILTDYNVRQVVFEIKNSSHDLGPDEYRQAASYLTNEYGRLGFIINRSGSQDVHRGKELEWVREMYHEHKKLIVKLPVTILNKLLSKLRNPERYDVPEQHLGKLLDAYERLYVRLGSKK